MDHIESQGHPQTKATELLINAFRWLAAGASLQKIPGRVTQYLVGFHMREQPNLKMIIWGFTKGRFPNHVGGAIRELRVAIAKCGRPCG
ncbi:hypothetical protein N9L19_00260 [bacterium]|nr:hypothetical protein [bacterium]